MAVGTALAIAAGASALGGLFGAKMKSSAAKDAAAAQIKSSQQAQDYVRQGMGQIGQLYSPYVNAGASAQNTLARLTTPGPGATYASAGPPNVTPMMPPSGGPQNMQAMPRGGAPQMGGYPQQPQMYGGSPFMQMMPGPQGGMSGLSGARQPPPGYYQQY